jgi:hypothetical protein
VWMEDWVCEAHERMARIFLRGGDTVVAVARNMGGDDYLEYENRLILAAGAPTFVRALLVAEWPKMSCCEGCAAVGWGAGGEVGQWNKMFRHVPMCPVDRALRYAGFADRAARDAARERMRER